MPVHKRQTQKKLTPKEIERNVRAVLQAAEFIRQVRLYAKPWKRTRTSKS